MPRFGHKADDTFLSIFPRLLCWVRHVSKMYELASHHERILVAAAESWDRMCQARELIAADGLVATDRHGQTRAHPAIGIELDLRVAFLRAVRELGLPDGADGSQPSESRPPRLRGRYANRD